MTSWSADLDWQADHCTMTELQAWAEAFAPYDGLPAWDGRTRTVTVHLVVQAPSLLNALGMAARIVREATGREPNLVRIRTTSRDTRGRAARLTGYAPGR